MNLRACLLGLFLLLAHSAVALEPPKQFVRGGSDGEKDLAAALSDRIQALQEQTSAMLTQVVNHPDGMHRGLGDALEAMMPSGAKEIMGRVLQEAEGNTLITLTLAVLSIPILWILVILGFLG